MAMPIFAYYMREIYNDPSIVITQQDFKRPDIDMTIELDCNNYEGYGYEDKPGDEEPEPIEGVDF
jgi:penicillin-binding protein 1A